MKGWPSRLPAMVMVTCPGLWAGMSACQESSFLLSVNAWLSMLADSSVGAWVVVILAGLPGWSCLSSVHVNMLPCLPMPVILSPMPIACM